MKRGPWLFALAGLVLAAPAGAYEIVQNGSFETGTLSSWQIFNQGASGGQGSWYAKSSGNGTYSGLPTAPPPAGSWQAVADNSGRAAAILYQDITIPATTRATLTFVLWYGTPFAYVNGSSLNPAITNQRVRVDLIQTTANLLVTSSGVLQLIHASTSSSPSTFSPTTITTDVTGLAGQTVRLRAALVGTNGAIIAGIDNVRLDVSPFAPTTLPFAYYTGAAHFGDFDNDGIFEVAQMGGDDVGFGWGVARWSPPSGPWQNWTSLVGMAHGDMALADIDRDGDLDMGGVGWTASRFHDMVFMRNDGPFFTYLQQPSEYDGSDPGTRFGSIDWGDYDSDGDLDALITGTAQQGGGEGPATFLAFNAGNGTFENISPGLPSVSSGSAIWNDFDKSGSLDAVVCGAESSGTYFQAASGGFYPSIFNLLPGVSEGALATGDLNNDGLDDLVLTGMAGTTPVTKVYRYESFLGLWSEIAAGLPGVYQSSVSLGDFDNDGSTDIAICGNTGSGLITRIYHNNGNETFTDANVALPGIKQGTVEFGDFDTDGDLDLLLQGHDGTNKLARVYVNSIPVANFPPSSPSSLYEWPGGDRVFVSTDGFANDDHTFYGDLSFNFRAGTSPGTCDLIPPMSNLGNGRRQVPRPGNAGHQNSRDLPITGIGHGSLYWTAQTVDGCYLGSSWAPERVLTLGGAITQVQDVPGDQGGKVRLTLDRSMLDGASGSYYEAAGYNVWRLVPSGATAQAIAREGAAVQPAAAHLRVTAMQTGTDLPLVEWNGRLFTQSKGLSIASAFPPGTWEIVGSFYATQQPSYLVASTTVADSGVTGVNNATFIVTVHTTIPNVWFATLPANGHSVDNLAPAAPTGLAANYSTGSGNQLVWLPAPEPDFHAFHVYRGSTPGFVAGPSNLVATVGSPAWTDPSYDLPVVYYKVSTLDHAGNESPAVEPGTTTAIENSGLPLEFALHPASPNPFGSTTDIDFALPRASDVRLEVFDAGGRLVRTLVDGVLPAGRHQASWNGTDRGGRRAEAGIYFYRLRAGSFTASGRVVLIP